MKTHQQKTTKTKVNRHYKTHEGIPIVFRKCYHLNVSKFTLPKKIKKLEPLFTEIYRQSLNRKIIFLFVFRLYSEFVFLIFPENN